MNNLKEIPEDVNMFTISEIVLMSVGVGIIAILLLIWLNFHAFKVDKVEAFKNFEKVDRDNLPEGFDHSTLPENIFKSRFYLTDLSSEIKSLILMISVMAAAGAFSILAIFNAFSSNKAEVEEIAFHNISEVYKVDFVAEDLDFVYEYTGSSEIKEVNAKYTDLDTDTRYDLVFVFKDNKEPVILKTGNVNDELIESMKR